MIIHDRINEFFNSKAFTVLTGALLVVAAFLETASGSVPQPDAGAGLFFSAKWSSIASPMLSTAVNLACVIGIGLLMLALNKVFNFVRSVTFIFASVFYLLEMSNPFVSSIFNNGTTLCLVLVGGITMLFSSYQDKHSQHSIFLSFAVLATASLFQYAFLFLIPAFLLGFIYMRAMNFKGVLAMLLGLLTPLWIALGLGIVDVADFKPFAIDAVWDSLALEQIRMLVVEVAVVALLAIALTIMNLFTIMNYRLQLRVYNAFFTLMTLLCIAAMSVDYRDMTTFVPTLYLCLSIQVAHAFTLSNWSYRYIFIIALIVLSVASCAGNMLVG